MVIYIIINITQCYYYYMTKYIIYLEGSISAGKSTLLPRISNALRQIYKMNIYEYLEPLNIWNDIKKCDKPILQLLYDNPNAYAPTFQYLTLKNSSITIYGILINQRRRNRTF